jgi:hypothetical protein
MTKRIHRPKVGRPPGAKNKPVDTDLDSKWITGSMFCRKFRCSPASFYRLHHHNLRIAKFGKRTLIDGDDADRYAESLVREPETPSGKRSSEVRPSP